MRLLAEKLFLLAINNSTGEPITRNIFNKLQWGFAGSLLIDLMRIEKIAFDGNNIVLQDPSLTEDELLNKVLNLITCSTTDKSIEFWLHQIILEVSGIQEEITNRLIEKGYIKVLEKPVKFGTRTYYEVLKPNMKKKLVARIKDYLLGRKRPSFPYRGLIALVDSCELHRIMGDGSHRNQVITLFKKFKYYTRRRVKKYYFLAKLNEEIIQINKIPILA